MIQLDSKLLFTIVNLLILYFLMKKFLFGPVTEFMSNRTNSIQNQINEAKTKMQDAEEFKKQAEDMLQNIHNEANKIIEAAKQNAHTEYYQIIQQARNEAQNVIDKTNANLELERQKILKDIRAEITSLAFAAASKVIETNIDTEENRKLIEKFLDEKGVA